VDVASEDEVILNVDQQLPSDDFQLDTSSETVVVPKVETKHQLRATSAPAKKEKPHSDDIFHSLFHSIADAKYIENFLGSKPTPTCKEYSNWEVFKYNFLFWCTGFMVGVNFTHADIKPIQRLTLDPKVIATWGVGKWILALVLLALICLILLNLGYHYMSMGLVYYYIAWGLFIYAAMKWNTKRQKENNKHIHIHHYFVALVLMSFIQLQNPLMSNIHGFFHGMFIEGGCRWGYDPIWVSDDEEFA
jgi:hypothetical protein